MGKKEKKSNMGMIIIIILLLVVIVVGGLVAFLVLSKKSGNPPKIVEQVVTIDETVVNLKDPSMKKYVKFSLAITYDSKNKKILEDINSNMYKIKDSIITVFKDKTVNDVESETGIEGIKQEIKTNIDEILEDNKILSVYFTNLLLH